MQERYLLYRMKRGDQAALDEWIGYYYPLIYRYLLHKAGKTSLAEDLCQEVFIRFLRTLPTYHDEGKSLNYLYTLARHCLYDHYREQNETLWLDEALLADDTALMDTILRHEIQSLMAGYLQTLKPSLGQIIRLHYFSEMTFKEIADELHLPLSTVKTRHYAGLRQLAKKMTKEERQWLKEWIRTL